MISRKGTIIYNTLKKHLQEKGQQKMELRLYKQQKKKKKKKEKEPKNKLEYVI